MSEGNLSPSPKCQIKPSLKKSGKVDQSKSKKKHVEVIDESKNLNQNQNDEITGEEKIDQVLLSKSSKKKALQQKSEAQFQEHAVQAERSEKSAKVMKSIDRATTIKENHNTVDSNQRDFSLSKGTQEHLQVSKKKINTESKKSKIVESKLSKTETKNEEVNFVHFNQIKDQAHLVTNESTKDNHLANKDIIKDSLPEPSEKITSINENEQPNLQTGTQKETEHEKDTKMSKNLKRSEISKSDKEIDENARNMKKSKESKKGAPKSQAKSKDSKSLHGKSGLKKSKPNERWH